MKKFTFKGVLDGLRSSVSQQQRNEQEIVETLKSDHFQVAKTFRHGFPNHPTAVAFDPIQRLLAIGTKNGSLRILGRAGVDCHVWHEGENAVIQIAFLVNEGALVTATTDDSLHLWNFRQKRPELVHSLQFQRERITCIHLPLQSKWLYVGSERGNVHIINIESFQLSGYVINWNKAIEVSRKTHPGSIVHLSDNPLDSSKLLIGFECGALVLWDLRSKIVEGRWQANEPLRSATWHYEGKQFMSSHQDGSLLTWNIKQLHKPVSAQQPHGKLNKDGKPETCKPIHKLEWKAARNGEHYIVFCGGLSNEAGGRSPSITIMIQGKSTTVLEMEHNVMDFVTLCESPYAADMNEPYAVVVLLQNDLVVIDLTTPGFPCFESPYPMDVHECPVTCCTYLADCPSDLIPAFYSVGSRSAAKRHGFSDKDWPLSGGEWTTTPASYNEIIITGHADGSIKFWDASAGTLQILYKLKTNKIFEKPAQRSQDRSDDDPFAVQLISLCPESRRLAIAGASGYVILFKFKKLESTSEIHVLEVPLAYESYDDLECSPEGDYSSRSRTDDFKSMLMEATVKVKIGPQKKAPGFQASLVCISPATITSLGINSSYGLLSYGTDMGLVVVDMVHRVCLLNMASPDLYGGADPYQRVPRSPKRTQAPETALSSDMGDRCRSPSIDQGVEVTEDSIEGSLSPLDETQSKVKRSVAKRASGPCLETMESSEDVPSVTVEPAPRPTDLPLRPPRKNDKIRDTRLLSVPNIKYQHSGLQAFKRKIILEGPLQTLQTDLMKVIPQIFNRKKGPLNGGSGGCSSPAAGRQSAPGSARAPPEPVRRSRSQDKLDSSFSRSRSSSMSSLDNVSSEAIQCIAFADTYTKKSETSTCPTLWVGTSLGSVLTVMLNVPAPDIRLAHPVTVTPSGTMFRLKGCILTMSFLDYNGALIPYTFETWRDENKERRTPTRGSNSRMSPPNSATEVGCDRQFVAIVSEKQAIVVALPSQNLVYRNQITETDFVVKAEIISLKDSVCLVCYLSNGHIIAYSLPSLRPLIDIDFLPLADLSFQTRKAGIVDPMLSIWGQQMFVNEETDQIARTFCFSNRGHGLYLGSPSEIQMFTVSSEFCSSLSEMVGELFLPHDMPEPPKESFFRGLFGGGARSLDREELFGESSGKGSRTVAKHIPGSLAALDAGSQRATSEISRAHQLAMERGEKLTQLEERTQRMMTEAESFSVNAHSLMLKYKDKKWYQL